MSTEGQTALSTMTASQQLAIQRKIERAAEIKELVVQIKEMGDPQLAMDAFLLCQKKFKVAGGVVKQMEPYQAVTFSRFARSQGLDPFGNGVFYDLENDKPGLTTEGKKQKARDGGYNFGPPKFSPVERDWPKNKAKILGFDRDIGIRCEMEVQGFREPATYTAWVSEWYMSANPNWKTRTEHMLQVRAMEKAMSMSSGVGVSEQISDLQLGKPEASVVEETPTIQIKEVEFKEAQ